MPRTPPPVIAPTDAVAMLPKWSVHAERAAIERRFVFADFAEAFGFMARIAIIAEKHDHHPEWFNVYNRVDVVLTTHESGGVTERDLALANIMDAACGDLQNTAS